MSENEWQNGYNVGYAAGYEAAYNQLSRKKDSESKINNIGEIEIDKLYEETYGADIYKSMKKVHDKY